MVKIKLLRLKPIATKVYQQAAQAQGAAQNGGFDPNNMGGGNNSGTTGTNNNGDDDVIDAQFTDAE